MYRAYIINELYTFIEKGRRLVTKIPYLCHFVSPVETNCFHGRNKQFPRRKLKQRSVIVTTFLRYVCRKSPFTAYV